MSYAQQVAWWVNLLVELIQQLLGFKSELKTSHYLCISKHLIDVQPLSFTYLWRQRRGGALISWGKTGHLKIVADF